MDAHGARKPFWITEFGTYAGEPEGGRGEQTEEFQSAWYFRYSVIGFANGVTRIFVDLEGAGNSGITASALYDSESGTARLLLTTLMALDAKLKGFDSVTEIAEGQYRFEVNGESVYALWDGEIPEEITGAQPSNGAQPTNATQSPG